MVLNLSSRFRNENETIELNNLDPIEHNIANEDLILGMENKIVELTERIQSNSKTTTFDLVQRGALQRKVCCGIFKLKEIDSETTSVLSWGE